LLPKKYGDRQQLDVNVNHKMSMVDYLLQQHKLKNVTPNSKALESDAED